MRLSITVNKQYICWWFAMHIDRAVEAHYLEWKFFLSYCIQKKHNDPTGMQLNFQCFNLQHCCSRFYGDKECIAFIQHFMVVIWHNNLVFTNMLHTSCMHACMSQEAPQGCQSTMTLTLVGLNDLTRALSLWGHSNVFVNREWHQ